MSETLQFITSFYQTPAAEPVTDVQTEPNSNYQPYHLFVLRNKLISYIQTYYPRLTNVGLSYPLLQQDDLLYISIQIMNGPKPYELNSLSQGARRDLQNTIDILTSQDIEMALVWQNQRGSKWPVAWIASVISYLRLPSHYKMSYRISASDCQVYAQLDMDGDYISQYEEINEYVEDTLDDLWQKGTIAIHNSYPDEIARMQKNWRLQLIRRNNKLSILQADWQDLRFAPNITAFLLRKLRQQSNAVIFQVGYSNVVRYHIALALANLSIALSFNNHECIATVDDLDGAQIVAAAIDSARVKEAKVITLLTASAELAEKYEHIINNRLPTALVVTYIINHTLNPYAVAFTIPLEEDEYHQQQYIINETQQLLLQT